MDLQHLVVSPDATLLAALRAIDKGGQAIALVSTPDRVVVGAVTDGDIRRALLSGVSLEDPVRDVMTRSFIKVGPGTDRNHVLDLMRARGVAHVPVVDEEDHLVGLHTLREMVGGSPRPNWALIMAGGRGTRMGGLTEAVPKPMLTVAGRPILERLVLQVIGAGIRRVFIAVNHLAEVIENHFGDGRMFGCSIEYLREHSPLGTAGAVGLLPTPMEDPLLVLNGDLVTQADLGTLLDDHSASDHIITVALRQHAIDVPYGVVEIEGQQLVAIEEKPTLRMWVNAGIYVISPRATAMVRADQATPMTDLVTQCLASGLAVGAHPVDDEWIDVGHKEDLARARGHV